MAGTLEQYIYMGLSVLRGKERRREERRRIDRIQRWHGPTNPAIEISKLLPVNDTQRPGLGSLVGVKYTRTWATLFPLFFSFFR